MLILSPLPLALQASSSSFSSSFYPLFARSADLLNHPLVWHLLLVLVHSPGLVSILVVAIIFGGHLHWLRQLRGLR